MFPKDTLKFLKELEANNNRDWFKANKKRFDASVQGPALEFVRTMAPRLQKLSKELVADDSKVGGSLMRIYRDVRFSKDKTPYNTHIAFRFMTGPSGVGYYMGVEANEITLGAGVWQPGKDALLKIRKAIAANGPAWLKAFKNKGWEPGGESLSRPPQGFDKEHPEVNELKRKDFVLFKKLKPAEASKPGFADAITKNYAAAKPAMVFLANALKVKF